MYKKIISVIFTFIILTCCLGNTIIKNKEEKIYKNVYIENINMESMTEKQCIDILNEAYPLEDINLKYNSKVWTIHPSDIDFRYKVKEATNKALSYTRTAKKLENLKRKSKLILNERHHIALEATYDKDKLDVIIDCIAQQIDREALSATLAIENDGSFKRLPSKDGKELQKDEIKKEIDDIIKNKNIMDLNLPVKTTIPKLKTEDVESVNSILGQFSTAFNNETSRGSNIHVAGESSSDIIIMPQETYSYNNATGPRVLSKGYKYAPVIVGGKYINGEGGGVCQVSTTIYNAALLAGLEIVEVHNHTYLSHYVSGGRDATVAYGYYDLKFKNPYSHPIYIKNIVSKGSITSKIYGCRDDAQRIYERTEHEYKKDKIIIKTYRVYLDKENKKIKEELISTNKYDNK